MANDRHVVKNGNSWSVKSGGRVESTHRTQANANESAIKTATRVGADVVIHGLNGQIREKNTYGKPDPLPPRDKK